MSALFDVLTETRAVARGVRTSVRRELSGTAALPAADTIRGEQIQSLVQQLFFRADSKSVKNVGVTAMEAGERASSLCLDVATTLAETNCHDVGLIDASFDSIALQQQLEIVAPARQVTCWPVAPHLWLVPRDSWRPATERLPITNENLERLREIAAEFDFSILYCGSTDRLASRAGEVCDGMVLVLTANATRRLAAAQVKDQLNRTNIPLLGTVLTERRFPVPGALYRTL